MTKQLLSHTLRASEAEVEHAHSNVLAELYAEGRSRVGEERLRHGLVPLSAVVVTIIVEQWVEEEEE